MVSPRGIEPRFPDSKSGDPPLVEGEIMRAHPAGIEPFRCEIQSGGEHGGMVKQPATVALVFYNVAVNDASGDAARTLVSVVSRRGLHIEGSSRSWKVA